MAFTVSFYLLEDYISGIKAFHHNSGLKFRISLNTKADLLSLFILN